MVEKMRKIFGKIFIIFIVFISAFSNARVSMEVRTESGQQNQVVVGQPFTLEVTIDDVYGSIQVPKIKGLDKFVVRQSGSYMSSINGKSTARYSYQVRIDTIGSYVLGPAVITHQQQQFISNEVSIDVVKDIGVTVHGNKNNQSVGSKTFLRLMVDSESVVVGQKIGCILRFYYQDPSLSLHNISMPELPGFDIKEIGKLEGGTAEIDGVSYKYAQWQWDMYPTKPGEFIIPAYNADYDLPIKDNNHLLGGLFMLINNRVDRKRVYSNAVTIKVSPLPHSNSQVHAVGVFERISADIKPGVAKAGEGMVLVIEIEGVGNLDAIAVPILKMPEALKYYDSNNTIIAPKHSDELPKKRFEFIVQGMQSGSCEIPEQLFTYFDIERNEYVTLHTSVLAISIMPGINNIKKDIVVSTQPLEQLQKTTVDEEKIAHINTIGKWYPVAENLSLPWWLFEVLFLIPCLYFGYPFVVKRCIALTGNSRRLARRRAFKQARKKVEIAAKVGEDKNLYVIFMELFQELKRISGAPSAEYFNISVDGWNDFFERITYAAYAQSDNKDTSELCRMAKQWLECLEKII
jgi:hypothetical protein